MNWDMIYKLLAVIEQLAGHPQASNLKAAALAQLAKLEGEAAEDNKAKAEAEAKKAAAEAEAQAKKAAVEAAKQEKANVA